MGRRDLARFIVVIVCTGLALAAPDEGRGPELAVFDATVAKIEESYVDPTRVNPRAMLVAALDGVQRNTAEIMVEPGEDRHELSVQVNEKKQSFTLDGVDSLPALRSKTREIFQFIRSNVSPDSDPAKIEYAAVNGMLSTLDPHSSLLDPESAREMGIGLSGKFGGLGLVIATRKDKTTGAMGVVIRRLVPGDTPARRAGLAVGDRIVKINEESTENLTVVEAMNRLRGDPGTQITIVVERKDVAGVTPYTLERSVIHVTAVRSELLEKRVGYLKIDSFTMDTSEDLRRAMEALRRNGARAWVLDLRDNAGGRLAEAIKIADAFLEKGTIVTTVGYAGKQRDETGATTSETDDASPMVLLVNSATASAGEVLTGALKHLDRALVLGTTTFGKGTVQFLFDSNPDGSQLKLTIAQYLVANDISLQTAGVTPDIELVPVLVPAQLASERDVLRLIPPSGFRESDLDAHFVSGKTLSAAESSWQLRYLGEPPRLDDEDAPVGVFEMDFEIAFARDLLASSSARTRPKLLEDAEGLVRKRRLDEEARIAEALGRLGVDWRPGRGKSRVRLSSVFSTDRTDNRILAGDTVAITGVVKNTGDTPAYQVIARAKSDEAAFDGAELVFGKIEPGAVKRATIHVRTPKDAASRIAAVEWATGEHLSSDVEKGTLAVSIAGQPRPQFAYAYQLVDDEASGDGLVQPGERMRLQVRVKNTGPGRGPATTAMLKSSSGDRLVIRKGRFELGAIEPGQTRDMDFTFEVKPEFDQKEIVLEMSVSDDDLNESVGEKLVFPVHVDAPAFTEATGWIRVGESDVPVHAGAAEDAAVLGTAGSGDELRVTGRSSSWVRVELAPGRPGFLPSDRVASLTGGAAASGFEERWQVTPPRLVLTGEALEAKGDHWELRGSARDDERVKDVIVLVSNAAAKIDGKKILYASNRGKETQNQLDFSGRIPLWPGSNRITVVARENDEVLSVRTVWIYRAPDGSRTSTVASP
jgi:carboxyl-terminal processing protease